MQEHRSLVGFGRVVGYLPATARAGDVLVILDMWNRRAGLILREADDASQRFRVLGPAVLDDYLYTDWFNHPLEPRHPDNVPVVRMQFDLIDLMLYICQDWYPGGWDRETYRDVDAISSRFGTAVCDPMDAYSTFGTRKDL